MRVTVFSGCIAGALALAVTVGCSEPLRPAAGASASPQSYDEPRFESLRKLIIESGARSVDEIVTLLPASFRSRYVLMHESRSLQEASYRAPRAILYSHDASFILTFNGDPGQRGYRSLETMEYDDEGGFVLREVSFCGQRRRRTRSRRLRKQPGSLPQLPRRRSPSDLGHISHLAGRLW